MQMEFVIYDVSQIIKVVIIKGSIRVLQKNQTTTNREKIKNIFFCDKRSSSYENRKTTDKDHFLYLRYYTEMRMTAQYMP